MLSRVQPFFDSMDCSPSGFSVHRISQARILEDLPDPGIESGSPALQADPKLFVDFVSRKLMILIYMEVQKTKVEKAGLKEIVPVIKTYHH